MSTMDAALLVAPMRATFLSVRVRVRPRETKLGHASDDARVRLEERDARCPKTSSGLSARRAGGRRYFTPSPWLGELAFAAAWPLLAVPPVRAPPPLVAMPRSWPTLLTRRTNCGPRRRPPRGRCCWPGRRRSNPLSYGTRSPWGTARQSGASCLSLPFSQNGY